MTAETWSTETYAPREKETAGGSFQNMIADRLHQLAQTISRKSAATEPDSEVASLWSAGFRNAGGIG